MKEKEYQHELRRLHGELVALQEWVKASGAKVCVVFEGRDTAGKGGTIKAITERVSPRVFRVVALPAPTEREKSQMYVQRYIPHFPAGGEVVIFDRSWYNRAGVERVMGFCTDEQAERFLEQVPAVEKAMVDSGILLIKYWLEVSADEQTRRLESRIDDPRKIWKLSDMDLASYARWDDYSRARDEMFAATDTAWAPWYVAHTDDKKRARLNVITHLLGQIPYEAPKRKKIDAARARRSRRHPAGRHPAPGTSPRRSDRQRAPCFSARKRCTCCTAMAPSPTADATRLIEPCRTSPAKKIPGELDSRNSGSRSSFHHVPRPPSANNVGSGQEEAGVVATHPVDAPRSRHTSDEDEQRVGVNDLDLSRDVDVQGLEPLLSERTYDVRVGANRDARVRFAACDQVVRHSVSQRLGAHHHCHVRSELSEIQGGLARRVRAADDEHVAVAVVRGLARTLTRSTRRRRVTRARPARRGGDSANR